VRTVIVLVGLLAVAAPAQAAPKPVTGKRAVLTRVSGKVTVKPAGARKAVPLTHARTIPMGSTVDTTRGTVKVVTTKGGGKTQFGTFSKGAFRITQKKSKRPLTELKLTGGDFGACASGASASGGQNVHAARRTVRRLFGHAHGRFRTRGRNSTATVRGTKWDTVDTCAGTRTVDHEGEVLAKSDNLSYDLETGQTVQIVCDPDGQPPVTGLYCLAVLSMPDQNLFAFGISAQAPDVASYDLCIVNPDQTRQCDTHPFSDPDPDGFRSAGAACYPGGGPGTYTVQWRLNGTDLAAPIPFTSIKPKEPQPFCSDSS
jgi:hypothetical protein